MRCWAARGQGWARVTSNSPSGATRRALPVVDAPRHSAALIRQSVTRPTERNGAAAIGRLTARLVTLRRMSVSVAGMLAWEDPALEAAVVLTSGGLRAGDPADRGAVIEEANRRSIAAPPGRVLAEITMISPELLAARGTLPEILPRHHRPRPGLRWARWADARHSGRQRHQSCSRRSRNRLCCAGSEELAKWPAEIWEDRRSQAGADLRGRFGRSLARCLRRAERRPQPSSCRPPAGAIRWRRARSGRRRAGAAARRERSPARSADRRRTDFGTPSPRIAWGPSRGPARSPGSKARSPCCRSRRRGQEDRASAREPRDAGLRRRGGGGDTGGGRRPLMQFGALARSAQMAGAIRRCWR